MCLMDHDITIYFMFLLPDFIKCTMSQIEGISYNFSSLVHEGNYLYYDLSQATTIVIWDLESTNGQCITNLFNISFHEKTGQGVVPTIFMAKLEHNRCVWLQEGYNQILLKKVVFVGQIHDTLHFQQATNNVETNESIHDPILKSLQVLQCSRFE